MTPRASWALLALAFVAVHAVLAWTDVAELGVQPAGDVTGVYRFWFDTWRDGGPLVGIDADWVYPIAALPPMLLAGVLGDAAYLGAWIGIVVLLDAGAMLLLARRSPRLAWWWLAVTALLGPVALVRIDGVALPIAVAGVLAVEARPWLSSALLTLAAWVKVWPAALLAATVVAGRRVRAVVAAAIGTSAVVIGIALLAGAGLHVLSFVTAQATRGLQIEAPAALPWLWSAALGDPGVRIYYDTVILTFQLQGAGVATAAAWTTPVLVAGVAALVGLAVAARLRGARAEEVLAVAGLGLVAAVIALNKVGSPQYVTWYVAPVLLGLLVAPRRFRTPATLVAAVAGLTQLVYPWWYDGVLTAQPLPLAVLTVRNALEVVLLGWSLVALARLRSPAAASAPRPVAGAVAVEAERAR